jgi:hypothetical protein
MQLRPPAAWFDADHGIRNRLPQHSSLNWYFGTGIPE